MIASQQLSVPGGQPISQARYLQRIVIVVSGCNHSGLFVCMSGARVSVRMGKREGGEGDRAMERRFRT